METLAKGGLVKAFIKGGQMETFTKGGQVKAFTRGNQPIPPFRKGGLGGISACRFGQVIYLKWSHLELETVSRITHHSHTTCN